jgi:hypothetical protein
MVQSGLGIKKDPISKITYTKPTTRRLTEWLKQEHPA